MADKGQNKNEMQFSKVGKCSKKKAVTHCRVLNRVQIPFTRIRIVFKTLLRCIYRQRCCYTFPVTELSLCTSQWRLFYSGIIYHIALCHSQQYLRNNGHLLQRTRNIPVISLEIKIQASRVKPE